MARKVEDPCPEWIDEFIEDVGVGIGTGTDNTALWMAVIDVVCVGAVAIALTWRLVSAPPDPLADERRVAAERASLGAGR